MLYPTKLQCWIHELLRVVFAHYRALFLIFAIFFIYLLIIYPACPARGKKSDDSTCTSHRFFFLSVLSQAQPFECPPFHSGHFQRKNIFLLQTSQPCGAGLFAFSQKKLLLVQRAVAWDRLHSFYKNHRRRGRSAGPGPGRGVSSPPLPTSGLHPPRNEKGAARPFQTPKLLGSIQKIQVAPLKDFLCSANFESLARRNVRATAYFHADANAPAGSQRQQIPFAVTTFP